MEKTYKLLKGLPNCPSGRTLKETVDGDYFISATDEELLSGEIKSYKFTKSEVEGNSSWFGVVDENTKRYSHFGILEEDQDENDYVTPRKEAMIDGYNFGDRLLEGVMFIISIGEDGFLSAKTHSDDKKYMSRLNEAVWLEKAVEYSEMHDFFEGLDGVDELGLITTEGKYN